jgi:threonine dehydratase
LVTAGKDFDESRAIAEEIQRERGFQFVPSFHRELVKGVATYAYELFTSWPDLDVVYVPIGIGTGISGLITVRDLLGLKTEIVGVVAENAPAFALSLDAGRPVKANTARMELHVATRSPRRSRSSRKEPRALFSSARRKSRRPSASTTPLPTIWRRVRALLHLQHS